MTYCFNILKKWSESCQNVLILQILTSVSKMSASIHLQTTSGKSKWSVMDNHGPILNPIPCQPPFRQSPPGFMDQPTDGVASWSNQQLWLTKQLEQFFVAKISINSRELMQIRSSLHSLLKICQGKMGQISVPNSCLSADLLCLLLSTQRRVNHWST